MEEVSTVLGAELRLTCVSCREGDVIDGDRDVDAGGDDDACDEVAGADMMTAVPMTASSNRTAFGTVPPLSG